jgi:hypothetical protein
VSALLLVSFTLRFVKGLVILKKKSFEKIILQEFEICHRRKRAQQKGDKETLSEEKAGQFYLECILK